MVKLEMPKSPLSKQIVYSFVTFVTVLSSAEASEPSATKTESSALKSAAPPATNFNALGSSPQPVNPTREVQLPKFLIFTNPVTFQSDKKKLKSIEPELVPYDYSKARYSVVLGIATWSERSKEVAQFFQGKTTELSHRKVEVVGLYTHDSFEDLAQMVKEQGYTFRVSKANLELVQELLNPKIPTIWVADHKGQVVYRLVRPTSEGIEKVYKYLLAWTDF